MQDANRRPKSQNKPKQAKITSQASNISKRAGSVGPKESPKRGSEAINSQSTSPKIKMVRLTALTSHLGFSDRTGRDFQARRAMTDASRIIMITGWLNESVEELGVMAQDA